MSGKPFMVIRPDGNTCMCPCSCVTPDSEIELLSDVASFAYVKPSQQALTLMSSNESATIDKRLSSSVENYTLPKLSFSNGAQLRVSENHTFIQENKRTITAAELKAEDRILDKDQQTIEVTDLSLEKGYNSEIINVIVNQANSEAADHVITTNGILSGQIKFNIKLDLYELAQTCSRMDRANIEVLLEQTDIKWAKSAIKQGLSYVYP